MLTGCFQPPVATLVRLVFGAAGGIEARLSVELRYSDDHSEVVQQRLEELESELLAGLDPWLARFDDLQAKQESYGWRKEEGRLARLERVASLANAERLPQLFADTAVQLVYEEYRGIAELTFYAGAPARASRRQRRRVERALDSWSAELQRYYAATAQLYEYLEGHPERARHCFTHLVDADEGEALPLLASEQPLVKAVGEAMHEAWGVLLQTPGQAFSLQEASRLVYDPFPARIEVELPRAPASVEGFLHQGTVVEIPGLSLWHSVLALEGTWLWPDPMIRVAELLRAGQEEAVNIEALASEPRECAPPVNAAAVRAALQAALEPAPVYRVTWPLLDEESQD